MDEPGNTAFPGAWGSPPPAAAQLLRSLQQRSAGKRLPVFRNYRLLLQPQYIPQRRISPQGAGAKAVFSAVSSRLLGYFLEGDYQPERFFQLAQGLEQEPEGGERCARCYELRLRRTAELARELGFSYFTTTLSISPYKDAEKLNAIGRKLSEEYEVSYLYSDFKKKDRYKRSIALSREYGLYRQEFCGCPFSREEALRRKQEQGNR